MSGYEYQPSHHVRALELLDRLDEPTHYVNDQPVTPLTHAGAEVIAATALAHAILALVDRLEEFPNGLAELTSAVRGLARGR